ncbi:hypothetical protein ABK040_007154 [Willaertia magna]
MYCSKATKILWIAGFFGLCGLHRLYLGKTASGALYMFTFGLCFIGQIMDYFTLKYQIEEASAQLRQAMEINKKLKDTFKGCGQGQIPQNNTLPTTMTPIEDKNAQKESYCNEQQQQYHQV